MHNHSDEPVTLPRAQSRPPDRRRQLVEAAYELLAEGGFEKLRTRDVARRVGVNVATLHYYFATKENLIRGVVELLADRFIEFQAPGTPDPTEPLGALRALWTSVQYRTRELPDMNIVLHELFLRSLRDGAIREVLQELDHRWCAHLVEVLDRGMESGTFRTDLKPLQAAWTIIAFVKGAAIQLLTDPDSLDFPAACTSLETTLLARTFPHK